MSDPIKSYKKKGKTYYEFQVYTGINPKTGKPSKTRRKGFITKTAAKKELLEIKRKVSEGTYWNINCATNITFKQCFEEWYTLRENELKGRTLVLQRNHFDKLKPLHDIRVEKLETHDIQKVVSKSTKSIQSKNRRLSLVKNVLNYALNQGYISKNPAYNIPKYVDHSVKEGKKKFLTEDELHDILEDAKKRNIKYYVLIRLLAYSGIRIGEAGALKWSDLKEDILNVNKTVTIDSTGVPTVAKPKTEQSIRTIKLDDKTVNILNDFKKLSNGNEYIFTGAKYDFLTPQNLNAFLRKYKISPHMLRHTHASLLFKAGVNPKVIQKRLGHASFEMTMDVYTHLFEEDETDNLNKFFESISK